MSEKIIIELEEKDEYLKERLKMEAVKKHSTQKDILTDMLKARYAKSEKSS